MSDNELDPQEIAFERSAEMQWNGHKLEPFSYLRKSAAIRLNVQWWKLRPEDITTEKVKLEDKEEEVSIQHYDALVEDIAKVLWLCTHSDDECKRARRDPAWAESQIDEWAEGKIFDSGMSLNSEAWGTFLTIMNDATITEPVVAASEKKTVTKEGQPSFAKV